MSQKEIKRLILLNVPYLVLGLLATNLGEAWRLAEGTDISENCWRSSLRSARRLPIRCPASTH